MLDGATVTSSSPTPPADPGRLHLAVDLDPVLDSASGPRAERLNVAEGTAAGQWRRDCPDHEVERWQQHQSAVAETLDFNHGVRAHHQRQPIPTMTKE